MSTTSSSTVDEVPPSAARKDVARAAISLADQVVVSGTSFGTLALLANWCQMPAAQVGIYGLAMTIIGFLRTAQERAVSNPYLVFVHQAGRDQRAFLGSSMCFQFRGAMICSVLMLGLAGAFALVGRPTGMPAVMLVLVASVPFLLLRDHVRAVCAAHFRFGVALAMDVGVAVFQLCGLLLLSTLDAVTIPRVCLLMGLACCLPTMAWRISGIQPMRTVRERLKADWTESWRYSRWLVAARTIGIGGYYAVPWFVVFYLSETEAGVFATCSALVGLSLMFIMGANNFFQPRTVVALHEQGVAAMSRSIVETIAVIGSVLACISACFFFAGSWLMNIFGPEYPAYGRVVFWLSLSMLSVSVSIVCGNGFAALIKPKGYLLGEISYALVACLLSWQLIPRHGLLGAAIALIGAGVVASVVTGLTLVHLVRQAGGSRKAPQRDLVGSHA